MKIIKIIFSIIILINTSMALSNWDSWSSLINSESIFQKIHWENKKLYVHEDYNLNIFSWKDIVRNQTNWVTSSYSVDWVTFWNWMSLFKNKGSIIQNWKQESPWISTMIEVLENTYIKDESGVNMPNQNILVRKYYKVDFNFDKTWPTWWELRLYNDSNWTTNFSYIPWTWLNSWKYYTMVCWDPETWCKCAESDTQCEIVDWKVRTIPKILGHMVQPTATFKNNVDLESTITWTIVWWSSIMYDESNPRISLYLINKNDDSIKYDFKYNQESNREYEKDWFWRKYNWQQIWWKVYYSINNEISTKADENLQLKVWVQDDYLNNSSNWVSWIKNYSIIIKLEEDWIYNKVYEFNKENEKFNIDWSKKESDVIEIKLEDFLKTKDSWKYEILIESYDWAWNHTKTKSILNIYPNELDPNKTNIIYSWENKYANNENYYLYKISLKDKYWNPIYNKKINSIEHFCDWLAWCKEIKTNTVDKTWSNAIIIFELSNWAITNEKWEIEFKLKSLAPWIYTNKFLINLNNWNDKYENVSSQLNISIFNSSETNFLPPVYLWDIQVSNNFWDSWDANPEIWKLQDYKISLLNKWNLVWYTNWNLDISKNSIYSTIEWHIWRDFKNIVKYFWNNIETNLWFYWAIDWNENLLKWPKVENKDMKISYILWWKNIVYYIDSKFIEWCDKQTLWLKVEWLLQFDWKWDITWQESNFSDLSKSQLRTKIRENAYKYISNMSNWQILNWVKYVEWNITIWWENLWYETLVVKNWNIVISSDLNTLKNKLWIIVIKDNYNVLTDYKKSGNIYVNNNVKYISASIYSDWAIRSSKENWDSYNDNELLQKLEIYWSLFTRNTIWWAVYWNKSYTLPWLQSTDDYKLAEVYDLNYIRKSNNCSDEYSTLIKYNPMIQTNPPKLFSN